MGWSRLAYLTSQWFGTTQFIYIITTVVRREKPVHQWNEPLEDKPLEDA